MWFADLYIDTEWVSERKGLLGPKRFALRGARSKSIGIEVEFHFFGDDVALRHVRVLMHTEDQRTADTCLDLNIMTWVAAIETSVMMETRRPFHVAHVPNSHMFAVALGQGAEDEPALVISPVYAEAPGLRYDRIAYGMAAWTNDVSIHLFYFRRLIDESLPLDVRWLNGYKLLEWHFASKTGLPKSAEWLRFVGRFSEELAPSLRPRQKCVGAIEEARALAAHAGVDDRSDEERARDRRNVMEKTFPVLQKMAVAVLNEHHGRAGNPVRFEGREHGNVEPNTHSD